VWHDPRHGDLTFAEWVQRYLSVAGHKAATTRSRDETVLRVHLVPAFGPQRLAAIAPLDVQHVVNEMAARLAPATVRTNYGVLRAVMNAAVDDAGSPEARADESHCRAAATRRATRSNPPSSTASRPRCHASTAQSST